MGKKDEQHTQHCILFFMLKINDFGHQTFFKKDNIKHAYCGNYVFFFC